MDKSDFTVQHQKAYLFIAFAHMTDSEVTQDEIDKIYTKIKQWGTQDQDHTSFELVMKEAKEWYLTNTNPDHVHDVVLDIANSFNDQDWFNEIYANIILFDLVSIAKADGHFHENEKQWIEELSKIWNVPMNI